MGPDVELAGVTADGGCRATRWTHTTAPVRGRVEGWRPWRPRGGVRAEEGPVHVHGDEADGSGRWRGGGGDVVGHGGEDRARAPGRTTGTVRGDGDERRGHRAGRKRGRARGEGARGEREGKHSHGRAAARARECHGDGPRGSRPAIGTRAQRRLRWVGAGLWGEISRLTLVLASVPRRSAHNAMQSAATLSSTAVGPLSSRSTGARRLTPRDPSRSPPGVARWWSARVSSTR